MQLIVNQGKTIVKSQDTIIMYRIEGNDINSDKVKAGSINQDEEEHKVISEDTGYERYVSRKKEGEAPIKFKLIKYNNVKAIQINDSLATNDVSVMKTKLIMNENKNGRIVNAEEPFALQIPKGTNGGIRFVLRTD